METQVNPSTSKKRPLIIGLALIAVLAIGATAYAMFMDLSPRELYLKSEMNTFKAMNESFEESFGDAIALSEKQMDEAYKSEARVGVEVDPSMFGAGGMEAAMIGSVLSNSEIKMTTQHDPKKEEGSADFALVLNNTDLVKAEFYQNNKQTALSVPAAYDKHVYFPNNKFGDVMRKFDPAYSGMEHLQNFFKAVEGDLSKEARDEAFEEFAKVYADSVKDENVKLKDDVDFKGEKLRQLTVSLSEKETKTLLINFIEKVENDKEIMNALAEQTALQGGLNLDMTSASTAPMSKEDAKKEIEKMLADAKKAIKDDLKIPGGMKQVVIVDDEDTVVSRDLSMKIAAEGEEAVPVNYKSESWAKGDVEHNTWVLNAGPEGEELLVDVKMESEPKGKEGKKRDIKAKFETNENGTTEGIGFQVKGEGTDKKSNWTVQLVPAGEAPMELPDMTVEIEHKGDQNLDKDYANHDYKVTLKGNDPSMGNINVGLNIKTKTTFGKKLNFPELAEGKAVNVAEMSDAEMMGMMSEIQRNIEQFIGENAQMFQGM
ncbi:DUF6583 family protein [Fictibacillus phosphorivorans]|uniref:DUF6583 family protein n=1 Tax=Fictibacillus phosphorivorans TaxID=1221500 RepID=UPI00203B0D68|nr:DUF6583 family protein [Fictibacillus phosphorivorans]MCM3717641.1 hypothetical protein [Fictibacillus phosphorivorans]MCM3775541.1 hypothetical protein [Fictibacillus phosphorivorans]